MGKKLDKIDLRLLCEMQRDSSQSQRSLADNIGISQNACWRRIKALEESGVIKQHTVILDRDQLGAGLVVFVMIRTRHHSSKWLTAFSEHVSSIPEVVDFFRIGGDYDYMLKVVTRDMNCYDTVYRNLIAKVELDTVTAFFAMEAIEEQRPIALK